jgi:hypothetical protein
MTVQAQQMTHLQHDLPHLREGNGDVDMNDAAIGIPTGKRVERRFCREAAKLELIEWERNVKQPVCPPKTSKRRARTLGKNKVKAASKHAEDTVRRNIEMNIKRLLCHGTK